jgi:hypothetical protein
MVFVVAYLVAALNQQYSKSRHLNTLIEIHKADAAQWQRACETAYGESLKHFKLWKAAELSAYEMKATQLISEGRGDEL